MKLLFRISFTDLRKLFVLCLWINLCLRLLAFNSSYLLVYLANSTKSNYHTFEIRIVSFSLAIPFDAHIIVFVSCVHIYFNMLTLVIHSDMAVLILMERQLSIIGLVVYRVLDQWSTSGLYFRC